MEEKSVSPEHGIDHPHASYPPIVEKVETLGYLKDTNKYKYGRQNSRSFTFGGHTYLIFGDSQVREQDVHLKHVAHNAVALVPDKDKPLESSYLSCQKNGVVEPLITLTDGERCLPEGIRVALWAFGGAVETEPEEGFIWYEINEIVESEQESEYHGVGIAKLSVKTTGKLEAIRCSDLGIESPTDHLSNDGSKHIIFAADEPRFGSFSTIIEGDFIYLWGGYQQHVFLARVEKEFPDIRTAYTYWNGSSYVEDISAAHPVLSDCAYGGFFKSSLFGDERPWVFVGEYGGSEVVLGAEKSLEGPWKLFPVHVPTNIYGLGDDDLSYICPQPWASNEENRELFVTWSEPFPGGVIGAKIKFEKGNSLNE